MSRDLLLLPFAVFLLSWMTAPTQSASPGPPAAFYEIWIGRFPSERVNGKTFLEHPDVRRRVTRILGADALSDMNEMRASFRAQKYNNWLVVSGCQPHMCVDAQWTVAIHLVSNETWVCSAPLNADFVLVGTTHKKPTRLPRKQGSGCPEGENIAESIERLFPTELNCFKR
jgi:hypothetical protein